MKMKRWFKFLCMVLACLMMILSGTGCAHSKPTQEPEPTDTMEVSNQNSDTTDMSDEEKESMMQDIWTDIRAKALSEAGIKVLFIGDSLTYYNDMPLIFEAFSKAAGKNVRVDSFTKGGTGIAMMRDDATLWTKISDKIASENWDIVVLQPQRNQTVMTEFFPHYPWKEYSAAKDLVTLIQDAGAVPLLYSTFGVTNGSVTRDGFTKTMTRTEHTDLITAYNATVSDLLGCKTVYAGVTFQTAYEKKPSINLYHTDRSHPCLAGSYLIAADFYTVIFGESAKEVNYLGGLETEMATFLREQSTLLLQFVPTQKAEVKEYSSSEKFSLGFGAHGFSNVAATGSTNVLTVLSEDHVQYVYQSGHGILSSFVKLNGTDVIGNQLSAQMKLRFGTYCGSLHPSWGFILATEDGKMIRMYARTNSSNITGTDCSGAKFEVRVDIDKKNSVVLGSYDRELTMTVTVTPSALTLYVNDVVFVTMTSSGAVFYEGTTSSNLKYNGQKVHLGLVFCYADVDFSNVTITTK